MSRAILWFGAGAASAIACALMLADRPDGLVTYCETNSEHPDNERFIGDCESRLFKKPIVRLSSSEYLDTWHVWEEERYIAGIHGAPCTGALKKAPRQAFQLPGDLHVFGYTADRTDRDRFDRFQENNPSLLVRAPLIERGLDKRACLALVEGAGIPLPIMYALGFSNNNCIPCPKATSPNYWAAVRLHFPEQFARMAKLSRELGARLCIIRRDEQGKPVRIIIDEIPEDWPTIEPISPACDFLCHIAEQDLRA
jgi:hypothetical protein